MEWTKQEKKGEKKSNLHQWLQDIGSRTVLLNDNNFLGLWPTEEKILTDGFLMHLGIPAKGSNQIQLICPCNIQQLHIRDLSEQ